MIHSKMSMFSNLAWLKNKIKQEKDIVMKIKMCQHYVIIRSYYNDLGNNDAKDLLMYSY